MSGPKHLWSGDWKRESAAAAAELADRREQPHGPESPPLPAPRAHARRRIRLRPDLRRALPIALAGLLLIAAGAYGLTALIGGSSSHPGSPTASGPSGFRVLPAVGPAATTVNWLGMQIETLPPGVAVIDTVAQGSPGDLAGLEPGDVIVQINNRPISATGEISAAIRGLRAGAQVEIQINRGSTLYTTEVTLAAPPSRYP
jgi:membrane-associated protease RseP (regulator of RpoE activity)